MIGIILASHGDFAKGIKELSEMIFGSQENLETVMLKPSMGPEEYRNNLKKAMEKVGSGDVLFLADLWGGTPFNQCMTLYEEDKDRIAVVAGLNLPMLIQALSERMTSESAHDLAKIIINTAREGAKGVPEFVNPPDKAALLKELEENTVGCQIPTGTVLGDGRIDIVLARVDTRLLHGQVATNWTKFVNPDRIIVVCDKVCKDELRSRMIKEAAPPGVKAHVIPLKKMIQVQDDPRFGSTKALLLFEEPQSVLKFMELGGRLDKVNLGSMAHSKGKVVATNAIALDKDDVETLEKIKDMGVEFDIRKVPADSPESFDRMIEKAKRELKIS